MTATSSAVRGVACGLVAAIAIAACASYSPVRNAPSSVGPSSESIEIQQLDGDIARDRDQLGLGDDRTVEAIAPSAPNAPNAPNAPSANGSANGSAGAGSGFGSDSTCHRSQAEVCTDTCRLSDSICTNTQRVCDIARDLVGDSSAADSCRRDQKICRAATAKCCACT